MMRRLAGPGLALIFAIGSGPAATAKMPQGFEVQHSWSRPAAKGTTGVGYMVMVNRSSASVNIVNAASPMARAVEFHKSAMSGAMMTMEHLSAGVAVPAGRQLSFAPGGYHLMFVGLTKALKAGDQIPATLTLSDGSTLLVRFDVRAGGAMPPGAPHR